MRVKIPEPTGPLRLEPAIQRYAWGDPEFIPELLGEPQTGQPWAEAWFGAHPSAPATVRSPGSEALPLDQVIAAFPDTVLGSEVASAHGQLPYLLKVLAASRPLSIQVHPNRAQARSGFDAEEAAGVPRDAPHRRYRDPNHKPEVLVALTGFDALCGWRTPEAIAATLKRLPEIATLLPRFEPSSAGLQRLAQAWFALDANRRGDAMAKVIARLASPGGDEDPTRPWLLRALEAIGGDASDPGLLFFFLLELVHLEPGEAMFLPAGVPHAYLQGAGLELMATSDNVLRAGLTSKHVDADALLQTVRFDARAPPIMRPIANAQTGEATYAIPAAELSMARRGMRAGQTEARTAAGPETLVVLGDDPAATVAVRCGEDTIRLRRGGACLVPDGVHYELVADGPATVVRAAVPSPRPATFRGGQPVALQFGTSGLRARVEDLTDLEVFVNTRGFIDYLVASGDAVPGTPVALAGDLRPSTDSPSRSIVAAVALAVRDAGLTPVWCGRIPTPALVAYGRARGWPSIMVTGSHIPADRNGIKLHGSQGEVLKDDEATILKAVARVRAREYGRPRSESAFGDDGMMAPEDRPALGPLHEDARAAYVRRFADAFAPDTLAGLRIAVYEHSSVSRDLLGEILGALGATVHGVGRSSTFVALDTEAVDEDRMTTLQGFADSLRSAHGPLDALVSTDGDGDRPLVLTPDADGQLCFLRGAALGVLVAEYLGADAAAVPISAGDLASQHLVPRGVQLLHTRIGSPWVIAAMRELSGSRRVAWEANGGFLTGSPIALARAELPALPTRDAALPIVAVLHAAKQAGQPLTALMDALPRRFGRSAYLDDVAPEVGAALLEYLVPGLHGERGARFDATGASLFDLAGESRRPSRDEVRPLDEARSRIEAAFDAAHGFGRLVEIDTLDGVRLRFAGDDVAHVRPSGNAPQLRIYSVANTPARAESIVADAIAPDGIVARLVQLAARHLFANQVIANIAHARALLAAGEAAGVLGAVAGSQQATAYWQRALERARPSFGARLALALHEDLPVNQAFGLLLLWQRLRPQLQPREGALVAFVFGDGTRATPLTEAECGQKPALTTFVAEDDPSPPSRRWLSIVELGLRYFAPVEAFLRRSGFEGIVVKWGDEVQVPTRDLAGVDPRFAGADVIRFVSMRAMTPDDAAHKDWVGVDPQGHVTAFIPRRPLPQMEALADRGLLQRRGGALIGGINVGSIALSRALLDVLLETFADDVADATADRRARPDLDPQLFTALTIAAIADPAAREPAWRRARQESASIEELAGKQPDLLPRLRAALDEFEARHGRPIRMVALDFGDQYWGDVGQHRQMRELVMALRDPGPDGAIARALADIDAEPDANGNLIVGDTHLGPQVTARDSVLIDAWIDAGEVVDSVLVGTQVGHIDAREAFDIHGVAPALTLAPDAGSYRVVSDSPLEVGAAQRVTTAFFPEGAVTLRVHENTDLRDRAATYDVPILDNPISFREAHARAVASDPDDTARRRDEARARALAALRKG